MVRQEQCATCAHFYFFQPEGFELSGKDLVPATAVRECRRFPPRPVPIGDGFEIHFPTVGEDDWCGEWKQAKG